MEWSLVTCLCSHVLLAVCSVNSINFCSFLMPFRHVSFFFSKWARHSSKALAQLETQWPTPVQECQHWPGLRPPWTQYESHIHRFHLFRWLFLNRRYLAMRSKALPEAVIVTVTFRHTVKLFGVFWNSNHVISTSFHIYNISSFTISYTRSYTIYIYVVLNI